MKRDADRDPRPRLSARDRALGLLAVRWRSREELRRRLSGVGYGDEEVQDALAGLERAGLVDDERFAAELVRDQTTRRLAGQRAIRAALRTKGVSPQVVDRTIEALGDEEERAAQLAARKALRLTGLPPEAAYRRLFGLLTRRGYAPGLAREAAARALRDTVSPVDEGIEPSYGAD
jgi:regulatory protein